MCNVEYRSTGYVIQHLLRSTTYPDWVARPVRQWILTASPPFAEEGQGLTMQWIPDSHWSSVVSIPQSVSAFSSHGRPYSLHIGPLLCASAMLDRDLFVNGALRLSRLRPLLLGYFKGPSRIYRVGGQSVRWCSANVIDLTSGVDDLILLLKGRRGISLMVDVWCNSRCVHHAY